MADARQAEPNFYGGQAVVEGVMIRSRRYVAVACRYPQPDGQPGATTPIDIHTEALESLFLRVPTLQRLPIVRGIVALFEMLALGLRCLERSANIQAAFLSVLAPLWAVTSESDPEDGPGRLHGPLMIGAMAVGLAIGVGLFVVLPNWLADWLGRRFGWAEHGLLLNLVEGLLRLLVFVAYVGGIGLLRDIRRVFMYHGAEHKVVNGYEAGREMRVAELLDESVIHPRCGTNFAFIVVVMTIVVFSFLPWTASIWPRLGMRLALLPLVAGLSFELIRFVGQRREQRWLQGVIWPGLALQRLTTREPTPDMIEVALASFEAVRRAEEEGTLTREVRGAAEPADG